MYICVYKQTNMPRSVTLVTLAGDSYQIVYEGYSDLAKKIHTIDVNFHPSFQRLVRADTPDTSDTIVFPNGLGTQPVLNDGEIVRLLMVNTVWSSVSERYGPTRFVCSFGHHANESGMWQFDLHNSDCRNLRLDFDWDKLLTTIRNNVDKCNTTWPEWQLETVISQLFEKAKAKLVMR